MNCIPRCLVAPALVFAGLALVSELRAQNRSVVPAACAQLPGNAALSMPLRWSEGIMQVRIDASLLPPNFIGKTISGVRLRRPTFLHEPAYGALQRTLTIRAGFDPRPANTMVRAALANQPQAANPAITVFGPTQVSIAATAANTAATQVGSEFLVVPFSTPLPVIAGSLFLEFKTTDGPLQIEPDNWVDAVWFDGGVERGYVVTVGDGSCTTRGVPTELAWNNSTTGPRLNGTASFRLTGAELPGANPQWVFLWIGLNPVPRAVSPGWVGFGNSVGALDPSLAGCHQWAPLDSVIVGTTDVGGSYNTSFPLTGGVILSGMQVGAQAAWLDLTRPGLPISVSNGVMLVIDDIDVGDDCGTVFFPGTSTFSPWAPYLGQMPVVVLEHN